MRVSIRLSNGNTQLTYQVTVPDNSTVNDLKLAALVAAPSNSNIQDLSLSNFSLIFSSKKLELSYSLGYYGITNDSIIYLINQHLSSSSVLIDVDDDLLTLQKQQAEQQQQQVQEQQAQKKRRRSSNKKKCTFNSCNNQPLKIVGDCIHCDGHYCSKHRLLESHKCTGLQNCKEQLHEQNGLKLLNEQTVSSKV